MTISKPEELLNKKLHINLHCIVAVAMAAALLSGCSGSGDMPEPVQPVIPVPESEYSMQIAARTFVSEASRANLQDDGYIDFAVRAFKVVDGTTQTVLSHADGSAYKAEFTDGAWIYNFLLGENQQYIRYWDFSASSYTFGAVAPYSAATTVDIGTDGNVTITDVQANRIVGTEDGNDWAVARLKRVNGATQVDDYDLIADPAMTTPQASYTDGVRPALTNTVPLLFHPLMAHVVFTLKNNTVNGLDIYNVKVELVKLDSYDEHGDPVYVADDIATRGSYSSAPGGWTLSDDNHESTLIDYPTDGSSLQLDSDPVELPTLVELPQDVSGKKLRVTITTANESYVGVFSLEEMWSMAYRYNYIITVTPRSSIILMDVDIALYYWIEGNDIDHEDLTNW